MDQEPRVRLHRYPAGRAIGLRWEVGHRSGEVSSGTTDVRQAERVAGRLEEQLAGGVIPGADSGGVRISWSDFRDRYEAEWLAPLSKGSKQGWRAAANHYENLMSPRWLMDVNASTLSQWRGKLEARKLSPVSVQSYVAALRAGLGWACSMGWIEPIPLIRRRRVAGRVATMRSRVPTEEEFDRMLAVAPRVCSWHEPLTFFMRGLWNSSLRISELNRMRWEHGSPLYIDVNSDPKLIVFLGGQKNRRDSYLPAAPAFWELVDRPGIPRHGHVFPIRGKYGGQMTTENIGRKISKCGRLAGVKVNDTDFASAHDLRAAFLTRLSYTATPSQMKTVARHVDLKTTDTFYVRQEAEALAEALGW